MTDTGPVPGGSCGAKIVWAEDQNGTKIPLNFNRVRVYHDDGCFLEVPHLDGKVFVDGDKPHLMRVSHFTTCPNAAEHSKGRS